MIKFKLIEALMVVLVTCKNEEDSSKKEGTRVVTAFLPGERSLPIGLLFFLKFLSFIYEYVCKVLVKFQQ